MTASDLDAAIQRLELFLDAEEQEPRPGFQSLCADLRTVIAVAKRPPLTDATREQLADLIERVERDWINGRIEPESTSSYGPIARAILAEYAPVVSTRERVVAWLRSSLGASFYDDAACEDMAGALLASGAVEDRAEVEAKVLEAAATAWHAKPAGVTTVWWLDHRAASIREGRS